VVSKPLAAEATGRPRLFPGFRWRVSRPPAPGAASWAGPPPGAWPWDGAPADGCGSSPRRRRGRRGLPTVPRAQRDGPESVVLSGEMPRTTCPC